ncbi:MAG: WecB/TagA/CpsF family glycosyltransferase [Pseudomonadota bacterium]
MAVNAQPVEMFGLGVYAGARRQALRSILEDGGKVFFVNAHCFNVAHSDPRYRRALKEADLTLPDGSGVALAARMLGRSFTENLNGTDLFPHLCRAAAAAGASVYFLGGAPGAAADAARAAERLAPGLRVAGTRHGYFSRAEEPEIVAEINASGADIVLVALGVPAQELWIARNRERLAARSLLGVGGLFDFAAQRVTRAPAWVRRLGCEWAWRLAMEPRRMARRYLLGNPLFLWRAALHAVVQRARGARGGSGRTRAAAMRAASMRATAVRDASPLAALQARPERLQ